MGINVFEKYNEDTYLIGSFSGLFLWNPNYQVVYDYISGKPNQESSFGSPIGNFTVSGLLKDLNKKMYMIDYSRGTISLGHNKSFTKMPENIILKSPISLWNLALEIHTGRIFNFIFSDFYILIVPLTGITSVIVLISGYLLLRRKKNVKKPINFY